MEHEALIAGLAHKLYKHNSAYSFEDLFQIGLLSALRLLKTYDRTKSKLTTYWTICVRRDMIHFMNSHKNKRRGQDFVSSHSDDVPLWELSDGLGPEDKEIIRMLYEGHSKREIAKRFHLTKSKLEERVKKIGLQIYG